MKIIIFKILAGLIACAGLVLSIIVTEPLVLLGFLTGGVIIYELAEIIENLHK